MAWRLGDPGVREPLPQSWAESGSGPPWVSDMGGTGGGEQGKGGRETVWGEGQARMG